jgi:hypothetical protein
MVRRDVDALGKWAVGSTAAASSAAAMLPHAISLPPLLAASLAWLGGLGLLITATIGIAVGLTKLIIQTTLLVDALDSLRRRIRRFRRCPKRTTSQ